MLRKIFPLNKSKLVKSDAEWGFDRQYYIKNNPDVALNGDDPRQHYMDHGWQELRDPSDYFSTTGYLKANTDVATAQINPLRHFREHGMAEGRTGWQKRRPEEWSALTTAELNTLQKQIMELRHLLGTQRSGDPIAASSAPKNLSHMTSRAARIFNQFLKIAPSNSLG